MRRSPPEFWERQGPLPSLMAPLGWAYGAVGRLRRAAATPWRAPVPVLCVGNLVVGGAGKTPVAIDLAGRLIERGERPHLMSRGYGGALAGPVQVDPARHGHREVGDEALLLARVAPTWIARDRAAGAKAAIAAGATVLVLDDGFQNPSLVQDLGFVVVDGRYGFGNGHVLPAGPLREPMASGLARADAVVVMGEGELPIVTPDGTPLLHAHLVLREGGPALQGGRVVAFAGIGRPQKFFEFLDRLGASVVARHAFADHQPYTAAALEPILAEAARTGAQVLTTEKDGVRIPVELRDRITPVPVAVRWDDSAMLDSLLERLTHQVLVPSRRPLGRRLLNALLDALEGGGAWLLFGLSGRLPVAWASGIAGSLARAIGPHLAISRRARQNLRRALPGLDEGGVEQIVRGMWDNLGRVAAEYAHLGQYRVYEPGGRIEMVGAETIRRHGAPGERAIFFSGHFGNWEVATLAVTQAGLGVAEIYRAANNPIVDGIINYARSVIGSELVPKGTLGARRALAALKQGRHIAMLVDQKMNDGIPVPFFGRDAMTAPALAKFALHFGCAVVPVRVDRLPHARFRITAEPALQYQRTDNAQRDTLALMTQVNQVLERWIRDRPDHWFWLHRRWPE